MLSKWSIDRKGIDLDRVLARLIWSGSGPCKAKENQLTTKSPKKDTQDESGTPAKKPYTKPEIHSESLMAFGALCNGTVTGGRKASTGAPNFCNATKLLS